VRVRVALQRGQRGATSEHVDEAFQLLDANILTLGFARRFAEYKRPNLLLTDSDRFARILGNPDRPVQIIVAGKAHPDDAVGKRLVESWLQFVQRPDVRLRAVFIEDYDMAVAQQLVQGVDVWINTPRRPWEACGTSGMKVLANGGLNLSELDGWWAEAYAPELGWALSDHDRRDGPERDHDEALQLYRLLENEVVPTFYDRDGRGIPRAWVQRIRTSIATLAPRYSSNRMAAEYVEKFYRQGSAMFRRRAANDAKLGCDLSQWHDALACHWHGIHFGAIDVRHEEHQWRISVPVYLGEITAGTVRVELYAESVEGDGTIPMDRTDQLPGALNAFIYRARVDARHPSDHYTPRVIPFHPEARVPIECNLIAWQR
jgi:glycogen phosphorylase